jgi:hypothetical protein
VHDLPAPPTENSARPPVNRSMIHDMHALHTLSRK